MKRALVWITFIIFMLLAFSNPASLNTSHQSDPQSNSNGKVHHHGKGHKQSHSNAIVEQDFGVLVFCDGTSEDCGIPYQTSVTVGTGPVTLQFTTLPTHCSTIILTIDAFGQSQTATLDFGTDGMTTATTGPLDFGTVAAGTYTITLSATGVVGGCNTGALFSWGGTLAVFAQDPCSPFAGAITVNPTSGAPGSTVTVTGSGWTNMSGSTFQVLLDGSPVVGAPTQGPLGCTDQPNITFDIPCDTPVGNHKIAVQNGALISQPVTFTVTAPTISSLAVCAAPPPVLINIGPAQGLISRSVDVTIVGYNFDKQAKVQVTGGKNNDIKVKINSSDQTTIHATFSISDKATPGNYNVQVCNKIGCSNALEFFVQIPSSLQQMTGNLTTLNGTPIYSCDGTLLAPVFYGYTRYIDYQVLDQRGPGFAIMSDGMTQREVLIVTAKNPANQGTPMAGMGPVKTDGTFCDLQAYGLASPPPPQPGEFIKIKQTLIVTVAKQDYTVRINCLDKEFDDVTITDVTSTPQATCQ